MVVCLEVGGDERQCFYCDGVIPKGWGQREQDHFPVPKQAGGIHTVVACYTCHHMKDRKRFSDWPIEWVGRVLADIQKFGDVEILAFLAKAAQAMLRAEHKDDAEFAALAEQCGARPHEWPLDWQTRVIAKFPSLSRETRVFLAKVMVLANVAAVRLAVPFRGIKLATAILTSILPTRAALGTAVATALASTGFPVVTSVATTAFLPGFAPQCGTGIVN